MTLFEKICRMVGDRRIPSPKMPAVRWFTVGFANRHVTTVVVLAIVVSGLAVAVGLYFAVKDVVSSTYNWPEPAEYQVTAAGLQTMGKKNEDYPDGTESQTLSIRLADAARVHTMRITDTHLGRAGITRALDISPLTSAVTGATAYLFVGNLTITDSSFPTLLMETSEVANLVAGLKCDGHTMSPTITNTVSDQVLTSKRLSSEYIVGPDSIIDKIQIHITGVNGAYIDHLILDGVSAWNGQAYLSRLKVGNLTINNTNRVGDGSGVDAASCQFQPSVAVRNLTSTVQDVPIKVQ
jgi:hypothetical protein